MKISILYSSAILVLASCSQPEPEPVPANPVNTVINRGLNEAVNEVNEQMQDTSSTFQHAMDTVGQVLNDNKDVINKGLKEIQKSF